MPDHIRFLLRHAGVGVLIAAAFTGAILWTDFAGIRHLVTHTDGGFIALAVFFALCSITFGSAQMGIRIMLMTEEADDDGRGRGDALPLAEPVPVRIREK
ncbi:hypothetical protein HKCCE3408_18870 [Rhodobacterales bacterium HKCCE3408]|nr:hypothetical protein [Rhodobacterales bacterium HKCCE3408]